MRTAGCMCSNADTAVLMHLPLVQIVCLEIEAYLKDFAAPFFKDAGQAHKLDVRVGDALESIEQLSAEGQTFDVVFLDAKKTQYQEYYDMVMDSCMLTPAGFLVVDNALMKVRRSKLGSCETHAIALLEV